MCIFVGRRLLCCPINNKTDLVQTQRKRGALSFAYSPLRGSGKTLATRTNNIRPRQICRTAAPEGAGTHYIPRGIYCLLRWVAKLSGFLSAKTSAYKRLLLCLQSKVFGKRACGYRCSNDLSPPAKPSPTSHRKITIIISNAQMAVNFSKRNTKKQCYAVRKKLRKQKKICNVSSI